jgi:hypothetical protein
MQLSLEIKQIAGAFVVKLAGAVQKRRTGLAWKSGRGRRTWQMYIRVSKEPGRAAISFYNTPDGDTRLTKTLVLLERTDSNEPRTEYGTLNTEHERCTKGRYHYPIERGREMNERQS